ncbi:hypothetical protein BY996DRAFT_6479690 [Phakopsora pachyrhizi]|nr:hypothetical protein BY996DRAFT_6479690 [Phakopsora pachyrhizi]
MPAKEQLTQVTIDTKSAKSGKRAGAGRIGTGWDGRRNRPERAAIITGPTKQGDKRWRRQKRNVDWSTDKEAMGREEGRRASRNIRILKVSDRA